jgi:hypothetical protein
VLAGRECCPRSCSGGKIGTYRLGQGGCERFREGNESGDMGGEERDNGESGGVDVGPKWYVSPLMSNVCESVGSCSGFLGSWFFERNVVFGG